MRAKLNGWVALLATGLLLASAGVASATSALYVTDSEQAALSTAVVVATVGASRTELSERYQMAITLTAVRVDEVLYGAAPAELTIEQMGGTLDGKTWYTPGDARLETGEQCVLFLRQVDGGWYLTAMEQSRYALQSEGRLGRTMHRTLTGGMWVVGPNGRLQEYTEPTNRPIKRLADFRKMLEALPPAGEAQ